MKSILAQIAATAPGDKLIFPTEDKVLSLEALLAAIGKVHCLLEMHGVRPGDTVALIAGNSSHLVINLLGVLSYGGIFMPVNPNLKEAEMAHLFEHAQPKLVLAADTNLLSSQLHPKLINIEDYLRCESHPVDVHSGTNGSVLIYTSGTTGLPKGVLLSEQQICCNLAAVQTFFKKGPGHIAACFLPLFHLFGIISDVLLTLVNGGKVVVLPEFNLGNISLIAKAIAQYQVNTFSAVPLLFDLFVRLKAPIPAGQLHFCVSGGAPLREELRQQFDEAFQTKIIPAYGVSEAVCFCLCSDPEDIKAGSVGFPVGIEAIIVDENGKQAVPHQIGEILLAGESLIQQGYYKDDRECYLHAFGKQWFRTGDLGKQDEAGRFYITGRLKNMIIKGGAKVYLEDVDNFIKNITGVIDAASLKIGEDLGEEIEQFVSFVVLDPERELTLTKLKINELISAALGTHKVPDHILFVENISRTATGKVKFKELQNWLQTHDL